MTHIDKDMNTNLDQFQALLARMRSDFLREVPERCDYLVHLILALEKEPGDTSLFDEIYRAVHSLKGSGGTHGLSIITTLCHLFENLLSESNASHQFDTTFANRAFAYIDLLRLIVSIAAQDKPDYSAIEQEMEALRLSSLRSRKSVLIAESSSVMAKLYQKALVSLPLQLSVEANGLSALERLLHEPFDCIIVGREIEDLNGIALMAALRVAQARNHNTPAILVTSGRDGVPDYAGFNAAILKDQHLAEHLLGAMRTVLAV